ncbi:hypothetical protein KJ951_03265 [Patescibacteria group bacterium]|nr:hypothetical protein [Patescibacteria group bacterium]MBU1954225.1 hypothetical protein [Patescibacteria group bacterium]
MSAAPKKLVDLFVLEVGKNILLTRANRNFLLLNCKWLPEKVLRILYKELQSQNKMTEKYIKITIDNNPELVEEIKSKARKNKKLVLKLKESEEKGGVEMELEKELKNI